jgi:hypothetical protein
MSPNKKQHTLVRLVALAAICPGVTSADAVQDWNAIMWTTTAAQNPFLQARFAAITHLAVFDAVNAITGTTNLTWARLPPRRGPPRTRRRWPPPIGC